MIILLLLASSLFGQSYFSRSTIVILPKSSSVTGDLRFQEIQSNGINYIGLRAPTSISASFLTTLPSVDGTSGNCWGWVSAFTLGWVPCATAAGTGIVTLNGLTADPQYFGNDTNVTISSSGNTHTLGWSGTLSTARQNIDTAYYTIGLVPINGNVPTFSGGRIAGGYATSTTAVANTLLMRDGSGNSYSNTFFGNLSGNSTGAHTGNSSTASASDHSITACPAGYYVSALSTVWALTCVILPAAGGGITGPGPTTINWYPKWDVTTGLSLGVGTPASVTPLANALVLRDGAGSSYASFSDHAISPCPAGQFVNTMSTAWILGCATPPAGGGGITGPPTSSIGWFPKWDNISGSSLGQGMNGTAFLVANTVVVRDSDSAALHYDKGADHYDSLAYGSIQAAINACENSARGGSVHVAGGLHQIFAGLTMHDGFTNNYSTKKACRLLGNGSSPSNHFGVTAGTIIQAVGFTGWMLSYLGPAMGGEVSGITFDCNNISGLNGILIDNVAHGNSDNLTVINYRGLGMKITSTSVATYRAGTVSISSGNPNVTGFGTLWRTTMNGQVMTISGVNYTFTLVSTTSGTLSPTPGVTFSGTYSVGATSHGACDWKFKNLKITNNGSGGSALELNGNDVQDGLDACSIGIFGAMFWHDGATAGSFGVKFGFADNNRLEDLNIYSFGGSQGCGVFYQQASYYVAFPIENHLSNVSAHHGACGTPGTWNVINNWNEGDCGINCTPGWSITASPPVMRQANGDMGNTGFGNSKIDEDYQDMYIHKRSGAQNGGGVFNWLRSNQTIFRMKSQYFTGMTMSALDNGTGTLLASWNMNNDGTFGTRTLATSTSSPLCYRTIGSFNYMAFCSSLRIYKYNIQNLENGLSTALALRPISYNSLTNNGQSEVGLLAEEVEKIDPRLATYYKGELTGVDYGHIVAVALKAIQELNERIKVLENRK